MEWFGRSSKGFDFEMFSGSHFVMLAIFLIIAVLIFLNREKLRSNKWRKAEIGVAISLIVIEITYHMWMIVNHNWKLKSSIPLELCNISLILCVLLLLTRKKLIFEILFFTAILGASQAIFTPALNYGFPHFRFFHFFYAHIMVVWVTLYFTWVKGYYPTFLSVLKLIVFLNILLPGVLLVNKLTNGNYWFLRHKPEGPSLLDALGPYPWYIFSLEGVLVGLSLIAWLIFRKWEKTHPHVNHSM
ncbi:YwaF family protein [Bacillus benzoevorans]|uniref:Putative integral membrane protein (TIGR02206 family) n=1 Tax=Bacillus benzoevorans TaxID=1456 RepID=A0A7X0LX87_9BACI|nr:TIGR02206 family membrane protein [Bacillus benzoevorans]MBB6446174.1 putative integral membrane protein (TIGR02206 family) [Bacillus benzoevorans]